MVNAQEWLDKNYPINDVCQRKSDLKNQERKREQIIELDISKQDLEGDLDLESFVYLIEININGNPGLGKIKNKPQWVTIISKMYENAQEWLNTEYFNPNNAKVIDLKWLKLIEHSGKLKIKGIIYYLH